MYTIDFLKFEYRALYLYPMRFMLLHLIVLTCQHLLSIFSKILTFLSSIMLSSHFTRGSFKSWGKEIKRLEKPSGSTRTPIHFNILFISTPIGLEFLGQ